MTVRMDAWPDFFRARLAPEGEGGGIGVAPTCAPKREVYPPSGGISPYLAWCISLALAPVEVTPSKPEKLNPRPAGALPRLAATRQSRRNCDLASRRSPARRLRLSLLRSLAASVSGGGLGFWPCASSPALSSSLISTSSSSPAVSPAVSTSRSSSSSPDAGSGLRLRFSRRLCAVWPWVAPPCMTPPAAPMSWLIIISCMEACSSAVGPASVRYLAVFTAVDVRFSTEILPYVSSNTSAVPSGETSE
mmetsp:Transcript_8648/g.38165  ORF Transcript_8648/g.38165 Transcript_8648/m.38165 type:complete len:248 (-) Transcript_8648:2547-3290(-)